MTRKAVVTLLLAVALWAGGFVSEAIATKLCNPNVCREEIAAACPDLKAAAFNTCRKELLANCRSGDCSCTDPTLPSCGPTTTTTSTTITTTSTTTTTTVYGSPSRAFLALPADLLD
jgi:hypothetical protein